MGSELLTSHSHVICNNRFGLFNIENGHYKTIKKKLVNTYTEASEVNRARSPSEGKEESFPLGSSPDRE